MNEPNSDVAYPYLRETQTVIVPRTKESNHHGREILLTPVTGDLSHPLNGESTSKMAAMEDAERRWPGIVILTERQLDDELGIAVYFTFPGGKYMAVWFSGTDELGVVPEDRPEWDLFTSTHNKGSASLKSIAGSLVN